MPREPDAIDDATLRLLLARGVGPVTMRRLRDVFGSDERAVRASVPALACVEGIGTKTARALRTALGEADPDGERRAMAAAGVRLVCLGDDDYPALLAATPDAPPALWLRGDLDESDRLALSIVGSRRASAYGREQAARFGALLAESGLTIVSGGALGIDAAAHRGALRAGGRTIAVLGCGLDIAYPARNAELFEAIVGGGALLSEHPMGTPPLAHHFPRRNRVISGLSVGVLVVEAALRSGALITARLAAEDHGREVMAIPGRIDAPSSAGCLRLLRDGGAGLVTSHVDVLRQLDACRQGLLAAVAGTVESTTGADATTPGLFASAGSPTLDAILAALANAAEALAVDELAARTDRPMPELLAGLTRLEIQGRVERGPAGVSLAVSRSPSGPSRGPGP